LRAAVHSNAIDTPVAWSQVAMALPLHDFAVGAGTEVVHHNGITPSILVSQVKHESICQKMKRFQWYTE